MVAVAVAAASEGRMVVAVVLRCRRQRGGRLLRPGPAAVLRSRHRRAARRGARGGAGGVQRLELALEAVEVVVVVVLVALLAGGGARVRRRVGGGRAWRARGTHPAAAAVDRAVQAVSVDLVSAAPGGGDAAVRPRCRRCRRWRRLDGGGALRRRVRRRRAVVDEGDAQRVVVPRVMRAGRELQMAAAAAPAT